MKAKSYLDKRTELLPGTRASLFVTDGWRGGGEEEEEEEEEGGGGSWGGKWLVFACSYAIREIECCLWECMVNRPHAENICQCTARQVWFLFSKCAFVNWIPPLVIKFHCCISILMSFPIWELFGCILHRIHYQNIAVVYGFSLWRDIKMCVIGCALAAQTFCFRR